MNVTRCPNCQVLQARIVVLEEALAAGALEGTQLSMGIVLEAARADDPEHWLRFVEQCKLDYGWR